jgi:hypothetical protein
MHLASELWGPTGARARITPFCGPIATIAQLVHCYSKWQCLGIAQGPLLRSIAPRANETCATFPVEISGQQGSHDNRSTAQSHGA